MSHRHPPIHRATRAPIRAPPRSSIVSSTRPINTVRVPVRARTRVPIRVQVPVQRRVAVPVELEAQVEVPIPVLPASTEEPIIITPHPEPIARSKWIEYLHSFVFGTIVVVSVVSGAIATGMVVYRTFTYPL